MMKVIISNNYSNYCYYCFLTAHPPIHPTKSVELNELANDDERNLYKLVVAHFLASCSKDAKGNLTKITISIPYGGETFTATGLMVLERNFLDVYSEYETWNGNIVPVFQAGQTFVPSKVLMEEGHTCPPDHINESDLITVLLLLLLQYLIFLLLLYCYCRCFHVICLVLTGDG